MNPEQLESKWASSYNTSPYAQRMIDINNQQGQEAASSMGLNGSSAALNNIQQGAGDITARDRKQYLDDLMQKYMVGIGLGQNLYGIGANSAQSMGQNEINRGRDLSGLEYNKDAAPSAMMNNLLGQGITAGFNKLGGNPGTATTPGSNPGTALNSYMPGNNGQLFNAGNNFNLGVH